MRNYLKMNIQALILIFAFIVLGAFCLLISGENFIKLFSYLAAGYLILMGITMIVFSIRYYDYLQEGKFLDKSVGYMTYGLVLFASAITLILFPEYLVRVFVGITLILFPAIRLFQSPDKKRFLRYNFWKFIVGIIFIIAADEVIEILFDFLGIAFFVLGIILIVLLINNYKNKEYPNIFSKYIIYFIKHQNKE